ncbi:outer membrane beta-barrel protein [Pararcticibacter amylolyticus]|uniref:Outer membrane protein beta-barrel domain-containing protein n=1 Tax=Pararcticibacter amylolyticus TaxID=2173175 RepID=A0A2U2PEC6_9SPHI|nr:outer membrane beta-barrel protein [Pararcticibacter amylolyticus]PWG79736.1 hypothetical protein DDR33_15065 [Pararcticibacter amylolyticus]
MKKLFIITALLFSGSSLYSQIQYGSGVRFGVKAGVNISSMNIKGGMSDIYPSPSYRLGYNISGIANIQLSKILYFQPGISLTEKGFKAERKSVKELYFGDMELSPEEQVIRIWYKRERRALCVEMPLNIILKFDTGNGKIPFGAGPYVAYGISYKDKIHQRAEYKGMVQSEEIERDLFKQGANKFDYGFNFLTGYELNNGLFLHGGYGLGLGKLNDDSEGTSAKHKLFTVSLGFLF